MPKGVVVDEFGVELAIEHNQGKLLEVNFPERGRRNGNVKIVVPGLNFDQLPAFDTRDRQLVEDLEVLADKLKTARKEAVDRAVAEGKDPVEASQGVEVWVAYRTHVVRDEKKVAAETPFDQIPSDAEHRHKRLMAIAEDRSDAASEILRQAEFECRAKRLGAKPGEQAAVAQPGPVANQPTPAAPPMPSGGGQADTYAFTAVMGMVTWAFEIYQAADVSFKGGEVKALAEKLLTITDDLQQQLTGGPANRNANSHTRVRGVLRTVIERHSVPVATNDAALWEAWEARVRKTAVNLLSIARDIHSAHRQAQARPQPRPEQPGEPVQ